jgi:hypothetical protein
MSATPGTYSEDAPPETALFSGSRWCKTTNDRMLNPNIVTTTMNKKENITI